MGRLFLLTALAAAAVSVLAGSSQAKTIRSCKPNVQPGLEIVNKTNIITYCGSAKATVKFSGKTYRFTNGACYKAAGSLNIGIGKYTTILSHTPYYTAMFLVAPAPQDGTYKLGVLTIQFKNKSLDAAGVRVVVQGKRSHGTFAGHFTLNGPGNKPGPAFTGTFRCR